MESLKKSLPALVGHRGAAAHAPENTTASFKLALEHGVDFVEGDFWLCADNQLVCIHDPTTARTAPHQDILDVRTAALSQLKKLDAGFWKGEQFKAETIPTLDEVISTLPPDRGIYIEIKHFEPKIVKTLEKSLAVSKLLPEQIKIISFVPEMIFLLNQGLPHLETFWLCEYTPETGEKSDDHLEMLLKTAEKINADGLDIGHAENMSPQSAEKIRQQGLSLHFWTVNRQEDAAHYMSLGADSLTSDRPRGLRKEITGNRNSI